MKRIHPFTVAIVVIVMNLLIFMLWAPNRHIGTEKNIETYVESIEENKPIETIYSVLEEPTAPMLEESCVNWYSDYRVYLTGEPTTTVGGYDFDIDFLAKLLFCEAGGMNWEGQLYTCSAILNYCDVQGRSLWDTGHDSRCFEPAPYVDDAEPTQEQYKVIDFVLNGGRVEKICYFRSGGKYHDFGIPVCEVDGHYFSMR